MQTKCFSGSAFKKVGVPSISGSALKKIAVTSMFIDHIGASLLYVFVIKVYSDTPIFLKYIYWIMRLLGRMAFPLFCFLLVEGAIHTHNIKKYIFRLGLFAIISEVPFDLAFNNRIVYWGYQNVYFTLALGLIAVMFLIKYKDNKTVQIVAIVACSACAELFQSDYGAAGVLVISILYVFKEKQYFSYIFSFVILVLASKFEIFCFPAFILMKFYNGERGKQNKYFFYAFYPVHLITLWSIGTFIVPWIFK